MTAALKLRQDLTIKTKESGRGDPERRLPTNKYEAPGVASPPAWVVCEEVETFFMACFAPCMAEALSTELWAALPTDLSAQFCLEVRAFGFSMTLSG